MAQQYIRTHRALYSPAAVGTAETVSLIPVKKGWRILWGDAQARVSSAASTTATIALQVSSAAGGASGGLLAAKTTVQTVGALIDLNGSDLAASGGFLCTADGTIQATYAIGATPGAVNPQWHVTLGIVHNEPVA